MGNRLNGFHLAGGSTLALALALALVTMAPGPSTVAAPHLTAPAPLAAAGVTPAQQPQAARVGVVAAVSEVGLYLGMERGYFAEQGLAVEPVRFESGAFATAPLSIGELEAASSVVSAGLFNAMGRGVELRIASPQSRYEPGFSPLLLNVRRDLAESGAIRDYADLRGRTIGVMSFGSTLEMIAERALQRGGLSVADANLVQIGANDQIVAFGNRAIDAGLLTEPQATLAADRGVATKWREAAEWAPGVQIGNILYGPNYITRNPDAGQRFMVAYLKGVRDYYRAIVDGRGDREAVIAVLMRHTPLTDRALYDRLPWVYIDPNLALIEDDLRATMQWFVDRGLVDRPVELNAAVDRRFVQHALSVLGPYQP